MQLSLPNDPIGATLHHRYQVEQFLGQGGMGIVYRAVDLQSHQPIAIKALRPDKSAANPDLLNRFIREGQILRELDHPNIVRLLDSFEQDGVHYLVMDYVGGGDLGDLIASGNLPDIPTILSIAIDIADALTRAHRLQILHRDIKPANVLLESDGTIRLTDFGIATLNTDTRLTEDGAILGTIAYLSPEACMGMELDERADIWSFGVLLYELLLGETPFSAEQPFAVMQAILHQQLPDIQALRTDVSDELADLLNRMLEKDPQARIPGVRHAGALLEDISRGRASRPRKSRFDTPPADIRHRPAHNLPPQGTPFVGREHELAELTRLLADRKNGFLSIVAPGGMGKTRLALALAERMAASEDRSRRYKDGAYFVELAPLSDPAAIPSAMASATGYRMAADGREPMQQVLDFFRSKELLLVLDNYEHLMSASALVEEIVRQAPGVSVVVTSRERLGKPGETVFHLSGMAFPDWETPEDALQYAAVQLFVSSARRARSGYELTSDNMDYVARVCRLTGGMPLGIVLAASWVSVLRTEEIAAELLSGLDILEASGDEVVDRQRSVRTVFEHTWQKMSRPEQRVFAELSVFRGGFTREAAQAVTGVSLPVLRSLVNQSLITRDVRTGRFAMHELLRQYAWGKLVERDETETARDAHAAYFAGFVEERDLDSGKFNEKQIGDSFDADFENIRSAWSWLVQQHNLTQLAAIIFPLLWQFVWTRWHRFDRIIDIIEEALTALEAQEESRGWQTVYGRLLAFQAIFLSNFKGEPKRGERMARKGLDLVQAGGDESGQAIARTILANILGRSSENYAIALKLIDESTQLLLNSWRKSLLANNYWNRALILWNMGSRLEDIEAELEKSLHLFRQSGHRWSETLALGTLGDTRLIRGEYAAAMENYAESVAIAEEQGLMPLHRASVASLHLLMGNYQQAKTNYEKQLRNAQNNGWLPGVRGILTYLVEIAALERNSEDAQKLLEAYRETFPERAPDDADYASGFLAYHKGAYLEACRFFEKHLAAMEWIGSIVQTLLLLGHARIKLGHLEEGRRSLQRGLERAYQTGRRFQYPRAIFGFAELANASGKKNEAVRLAGVIHNHRVTPHEVNVMVSGLLQSLQAELSPNEYQAALDAGAALDLDAVAVQLLEEFSSD